ncbi:MAG: hypothetical protein HY763_16125 [Planctomycetes bacterium]|nr:hypothetical protein [Planctomycetota bacterium]
MVLSVVSLLASLLLPSLSAARAQALAVTCGSNVRQVSLANGYYAEEFAGVYCPGASDFLRNLHRWHGTRKKISQPFDPHTGPLSSYLGAEGAVRQCPAFPAAEVADHSGGFERGNGGYGYNNAFVGVQVHPYASGEFVVATDRAGAVVTSIRRPAETVMFTDAAFAADRLIEYSFAEPRFQPQYPSARFDPSVHFRHHGMANVSWCDGHVDAHRRAFTWSSGLYAASPARLELGWFGDADDNSLFDLR